MSSNKAQKIILIMPGEIGLYLKDKLPPLIYKATRDIFSRLLQKKVTLPLSVLALAPYLQKAGFEPVIIDGRVEDSIKRLNEELDDKVVFVGISCLTGSSVFFGLQCAQHVRKVNPKIPIVFGGVHVTLTPEQSLRTSEFVDIVVRGEGEHTAAELAKCLTDGGDLSKVDGVSYKKDGEIIHNQDRPFFSFNDQLEFDYSLLNMDNYDLSRFLYQSERGCPHRCQFCDVLVVHRRTFRKKSAEMVLKDMKGIYDKYKPDKLILVDDCFFADFKRATAVIEGLIGMKLDMKWHASCRAQYFRRTTVDFWKRAKESGLVEVYVGVESGSQKILDYIKKDCTIGDIKSGVEQINEAGLTFMTNLMCGFPGEEKRDVELSMDIIDKLRNGYPETVQLGKIFLYAPCPGTPLHKKVVEAGFDPPKTLYDWGQFRIGHRSHTEWHPLVDYLWAVSVCSHRGVPFSWKTARQRLKRLNIPGVVRDMLGHIAWYRWKHRYFKYPLDVKIIDSIDRFFYLW
ncbi:MAG: radical SAM protein [Thermodesulfobacteriota bacterium]|nr:radical SAM protein [Thermodesulfobacteriota bacterium]